MKHVRLTLDAGGREAAVHPMYDVLVNAPFVDRAIAIQWNGSGDEFGIMHYIEGDREAFQERLDSIQEVLSYELVAAGADSFYAYVRDETTAPLRELLETVTRSPVVVVPPIEYADDGTIIYSMVGPAEPIQTAIDRIPDPITVTITDVSGVAGTPAVRESLCTDRQREAIDIAIERGYYEIPREASHEDVAEAMGCAPSTAAEHLRKAESTLIRSTRGGNYWL